MQEERTIVLGPGRHVGKGRGSPHDHAFRNQARPRSDRATSTVSFHVWERFVPCIEKTFCAKLREEVHPVRRLSFLVRGSCMMVT